MSIGTSHPETAEDRIKALCRLANITSEEDRLSVRDILKQLSAEGAFDLSFLLGSQTMILPDDIRRITETIELLASQSAVVGSAFMVNAVFAASIIAMLGTPEQRLSLLPRIRSADLQFAFALTEPAAGSDASGIECSASIAEHGYTLNGVKTYTTGASSADYLLVVARLEGAKARELSIFVVPTTSAGVTIEPLRSLPGHNHPSCRVTLSSVHVSQDAILGGPGAEGRAWNVLKITGLLERAVVSVSAVGLAGAIVRRATEFAKERKQFGQTIASFQAIQHSLVDMAIIEKTMRLITQDALAVVMRGHDASQQILMAKCYCSEQLQVLLSKGMRIMGGRAFFDFEDMARYYLEAPLALYAGGTIEVHKMMIARTLDI